jgi:hypothetical protein
MGIQEEAVFVSNAGSAEGTASAISACASHAAVHTSVMTALSKTMTFSSKGLSMNSNSVDSEHVKSNNFKSSNNLCESQTSEKTASLHCHLFLNPLQNALHFWQPLLISLRWQE